MTFQAGFIMSKHFKLFWCHSKALNEIQYESGMGWPWSTPHGVFS